MTQVRLREARPFRYLFGGQSLSLAGSMLLYFALLIGVVAAQSAVNAFFFPAFQSLWPAANAA